MGWKGTGRAPGCRGGVNYCTIILALQALGAISDCCHVGNAFSHTVKKKVEMGRNRCWEDLSTDFAVLSWFLRVWGILFGLKIVWIQNS